MAEWARGRAGGHVHGMRPRPCTSAATSLPRGICPSAGCRTWSPGNPLHYRPESLSSLNFGNRGSVAPFFQDQAVSQVVVVVVAAVAVVVETINQQDYVVTVTAN